MEDKKQHCKFVGLGEQHHKLQCGDSELVAIVQDSEEEEVRHQEWRRKHSRLWPCSRCELVHAYYRISAMIYGLDKFDCEILIPDLNEIKMEGDTIILPPHVLKVCDELIEIKQTLKPWTSLQAFMFKHVHTPLQLSLLVCIS
jgi:hypothetical protein